MSGIQLAWDPAILSLHATYHKMKSKDSQPVLDLRTFASKEKSAKLLSAWNTLKDGNRLRLMDGESLTAWYGWMTTGFKDQFHWETVESGPKTWEARLTRIGIPHSGYHPGQTGEIEPRVLDVRPLFQRGESPCGPIDETCAGLQANQSFILIAPFEPRPLFAKLARQGFSPLSRELHEGSWVIEFKPDPKKAPSETAVSKKGDPATTTANGNAEIYLDARGLEPPAPLVRALETIEKLARNQKLIFQTDRKPMHLFDQLNERGFVYDCTEQLDRSYITQIWKLEG